MLHLIAATQAEAEPVIRTLKLKHTPASFPLFCSKDTALVVSGIGKTRAAAASAWLASYTDTRSQTIKSPGCWINFGIAGHPDADVGSVFTAHKVIDHHSDKVWFPPQIRPPLPSSDLTTVDKPLNHYLSGQLHDMEASGFIEIARVFTHAELVQCVKVISDNKDSPHADITPGKAHEAIQNNINELMAIAEHLTGLANSLDSQTVEIPDEFHQRWKFSVAQSVILERLLQKHTVLHGPMKKIPQELLESNSATAALHWLDHELGSGDYTQ